MNMALSRINKDSRKRAWKVIKRDRYLFLMFLPIFLYYVIFHFYPMTGIVIAFKEFMPGHGVYFGKWVGLKWFTQFLESPYAFRLVRNTVVLSALHILIGFPIPIFFALCICEIKHSGIKRSVQTVSYLPHFISTVVLVGMMKNFFSLNNGIVNVAREAFGLQQISFFQEPQYFRALHVGSGVWQGFGWSSIIYISAITGIDPELYEAGEIDGITRAGKARHITLPMIAPTIILLFIMDLGSLMSIGFEKVFLMYNEAIYETADVISTYVYRKGISESQTSFASAVGLFNSVVNFILVFGSNMLSRKLTGSSLW